MDVEIKIQDGGTVTLLSTTETTTAAPSTASDHGGGGDDNTQLAQAAASSLTDADSKKRSHEQMIDATVVAIPGNDITNVLPVAVTVDGKTETDEDHDRILEISERLDILMNIIYERIDVVTTYEPDSLTSAMAAVVHARRLYRSHLENLFERKVRTTDRTKFVQFIFLVLFGRENKSLREVGRLLAEREKEQQQRVVVKTSTTTTTTMEMVDTTDPEGLGILATMPTSSDEPLYRGFIAKLIDYFYNPNYAGDVPRQTVVCYLASYVSRATYVCPETVCECLAALLRWAEVYISAQSDTVVVAVRVSGGGGSSSRGGGTTSHEHHRLSLSSSRMSLGGNTQHPCEMHALFYTCCQAAFYIFCFRGAEALTYHRRLCKQHTDDLDGCGYADPQSVDIGPERWKFLCEHPLQPLKYCLESVRLEFLTLAQDLNLFYVEDGDGGVARKEEATQFVNQLRINTSSRAQKKLKSTTTPKLRRSTIVSTVATQEKKRLDGGVGGLGRGSNPLDSFFPFDPYLLKNSYMHVYPYYRNWEDFILTIEEKDEAKQHYDDGCPPVEDSLGDEESNYEEVDDNDERIEDSESEVSILIDEDEDHVDVEERVDGNKDNRVDNGSYGQIESMNTSAHIDNHLEMEIRRSRAMSTGSQCSW